MITIGGAALALKSWRVDATMGTVHIVGRTAGLFGWLLSMIGVDANTELIVSGNHVTFRAASLFGELTTLCPMGRVASVRCGYAKPVQYLLLAALTAMTIVLPVIFIIAYFLEKRVVVLVETTGGTWFGLAFKRSVIEGVQVDVDKAREVVEVINRHVMQSEAGRMLGA